MGHEGARTARAARLRQARPPEAPPNIVVIETDDQTVEQMKVLAKTRRLLAHHGVTFTNSFVSLSLCCPSRATFLTGQYAHNHGVVSNVPPQLNVVPVGRRESSGECTLARVRASLSGPDSRSVKSVRFFADGRLRGLTNASPFTTSFEYPQGRTYDRVGPRVRARVLFVDGR